MLCDKCKLKDAIFHKTVIINGESFETHLCADCVSQTDWAEFESWEDDFVPNFFETFESFAFPQISYNEKKCDKCKSTFRDFLRRGKLGCDKCYETFEMEIRDMLENMESPIDLDLGIEEAEPSRLFQLERDLNKAIEEERYEDAGEIKKQINKLKEEGNVQ